MEQVTLERLNENVEMLKKMVLSIQEHLEDVHLSAEEEDLFDEYLKDKKEGKLISHEDLKAELGL